MRNLFACALACWALAGCATVNGMGVAKGDKSVDVSQKSLLLMTLVLTQDGGTSRAPKLIVLNVEKPGAKEKADRQNFKPDDDGTIVVDDASRSNTYELRMAITPGPYKVLAATGLIRAFPLTAFFQVPLLEDVDVPPNSVVYLGRIEANMRPRVGEEFRAGPVIPLIDQAVLGVSGGTFDVVVRDNSAEDLNLLRQTFPALQNADIKIAILPPFDRAKAQAWWEANGKPEDTKPQPVAPETTPPAAEAPASPAAPVPPAP